MIASDVKNAFDSAPRNAAYTSHAMNSSYNENLLTMNIVQAYIRQIVVYKRNRCQRSLTVMCKSKSPPSRAAIVERDLRFIA